MNLPRVPPSAVERIDPWRLRVRPFHPDMRREGLVFASRKLWPSVRDDGTLLQVAGVATLPGVVGPSIAMPDAHQGYGFPIGGVAATSVTEGVVSPGGVGFDINCGVRLLSSRLPAEDVRARMDDLLAAIARRVPVGFERTRDRPGTDRAMDQLLAEGAAWAVRSGFGRPEDLDRTEDRGTFTGADPGGVSPRARERGRVQVGTLGGGNHFVEVQAVAAVEDEEAARAMGLAPGGTMVLLHTGSRGLGHQVCTDQIVVMQGAMRRYGIRVPDRQLACAPVDSEEGRAYLGAMGAAANYAWANRQVLTHLLREAFAEILGRDAHLAVVYDVAHNIARIERHQVDGRPTSLCVHRKGATRAFPPGHPDLPAGVRSTGQPVFIPGSMGTASWVLVGTERALAETWGSVCHGAGRTMSRTAARRARQGAEVLRDLSAQGITVHATSRRGIAEEAPESYKDVDLVVDTVVGAGLARPVARLVPMGVLKG